MKIIKAFAILAFVLVANSVSAQEKKITNWPAMKEVQEVMARTFHPVEDGNLQPVKSYAETLMNKAKELTTKAIPTEYRTKEIMGYVTKLQAKTKELNDQVIAKSSDTVLKASITEAHDIFHKIVGLCAPEKH